MKKSCKRPQIKKVKKNYSKNWKILRMIFSTTKNLNDKLPQKHPKTKNVKKSKSHVRGLK